MTLSLRLLCALALAASAGAAAAQNRPSGPGPDQSVSVQGGYAFGSDFSDSAGREVRDVEVAHFGVTASQRWQTAPATGLTASLEYQRYELDVNRNTQPLPESVESVALQVSLRHRVNSDWSLAGGVKAGQYAADGLRDSDALGVNVSALALRRFSDEFTLAFGVIYRSMAESKYRVLPALGFDWKPAPDWAVSLGFPRSAVTYTVSEQLRVFAHVTGQGGTFYVKDPVAPALSSLPPMRDTKLDYTEIRVGVGVDFRPAPAWEITASVGMLVKQEFDYFERDYDLDADDNAAYAGVTTVYSF